MYSNRRCCHTPSAAITAPPASRRRDPTVSSIRNGERKGVECGYTAQVVRQPLDGVLVVADVHDGDARDLADAALEVLVARCDDVTLVLLFVAGRRVHTKRRELLATALGLCKLAATPYLRDALHEAVVGVRALVRADQPLEARVFGNPGTDSKSSQDGRAAY